MSDADDPNAVSGDTVQCRIYHAGVAGSDPGTTEAVHCPHAAIFGGGNGGPCTNAEPTCDVYCTAITAACGQNGALPGYADHDACMDYCGAPGKADQCSVLLFSQDDAEAECPTACGSNSWNGNWSCDSGTVTDAGCDAGTQCACGCDGAAFVPAGAEGDTSGNSVGCRTYHARASVALQDPLTHCPHAGASGGAVCGTWCDNYCDLAGAICTGANELYADAAACATACDGLPDDGAPGDVSGDSVQCRIYHLGVAGSDGDTSAAIHCPHAAATSGDDVCAGDLPDNTGDSCAAPIMIDALPFEHVGDTSSASNAFGCPVSDFTTYGDEAPDHVFQLDVDTDGIYTITLDGDADTALYIQTTCVGAAQCTDWDDKFSDPEVLTLELTAGTTYYIVADGYSSGAGAYTLTVSEPCIPNCDGAVCGGDGCGGTCGECDNGWPCDAGMCVDPDSLEGNTCAAPILVDALPFTGAGSTEGQTDNFFCPGSFGDEGTDTPDTVFEFTPTATGLFTMSLEADFDTLLYVLSDCADGESCLDLDDFIGDGGEELTIELTADTTYYVIVDGYFNDGTGSYTLSIAGP